MNNVEIQIQLPSPGKWGEFNMKVIYPDADGYTSTDRYTQENIPTDQTPALATVAFFKYFTK